MKSKMRESDIIFRFRHCLAFITVVVFLLTYGFVANATQTQTGTVADMDLLTYYGISEPVFFTRDGINAVVNDSSVLSYSVIPSTGATIDSGYYDGTRPDAFCFISSVNGNDVDWENGYHVFTIGNTTTTSVIIYDCQGPCYFAVAGTDTSVYSQYPFKYVMRYVNSDGSYIHYEYDDAYNYSSDGRTTYYCGINSGNVFLTDMPVNVASTDSSTGFDRMRNYDVFSVENYTDFNYIVNGGLIIPDAPNHDDPDAVLPYASTGLNYVFGSVDPEFSTPRDGSIFATYNFHLNSYMLTHPEEYSFYMVYKIITTNTRLDGTYSYSHEITVSDILFHNDQQFNENIDWYNFTLGDDNLGVLLRNIYTSAGNSSSSYTDGSVISYEVGNPSSTRTFGRFTAGVRTLYDNDISSFKFYYDCYFIWHGDPETQSGHLKGWKDLKSANNRTTQNDITTNYYPPSEEDQANYPEVIPSGGSDVNNGSIFNDGDVYIYNSGGNWTPYTLDQVSYANVKDMFDDIKDFIDSTSENSFWGVISGTFSYIPAKIWQYITITVAVICGFAVVRYVLRR